MSPSSRRLMVGDTLPLLMKPLEFRLALGFSATKFWMLQKAGAFTALETLVNGERFYSGPKVDRWLNDQPIESPSVGKGRRFLAAARRHTAEATRVGQMPTSREMGEGPA